MDNKALADFVRLEISKVVAAINKLTLKIHDPRQYTQTSEKQNETTTQHQEGVLVASSISPPPTDSRYPSDRNKNPKPRRTITRKAWRWFKRIFLKKDRLERIGLIAGIVYAAVTVIQWRDLRHNFMIEQRAWIQVSDTLPMTVTDTQAINAIPEDLKNTGKSVATTIVQWAMFDIVPAHPPTMPMFYSKETVNFDTPSILFPDTNTGYATIFLRGSTNESKRFLTKDEIHSLLNGDTFLVFYAIVVYRDQFGQHWTRRCDWKGYASRQSTSFGARPCVEWNAVGDGEITIPMMRQ
jgi:hypothetical protein